MYTCRTLSSYVCEYCVVHNVNVAYEGVNGTRMNCLLIRPGLRPAFWPEFVYYLGESGVLCVETVHIPVHQSL